MFRPPSNREKLLAAARLADPRAVALRDFELANETAVLAAREARDARDALVRELREEDPQLWTVRGLAKVVGCSNELIKYILRF